MQLPFPKEAMSVKAIGSKFHRGTFFHSQLGFGIMEVVISIGIVGLILTAISSGLIFSLKTNAETKFRGIALSKNQEVFEVIRRERVIRGWDSFLQLYGGGVAGTYTYCLNSANILDHANFPPAAAACVDTVDWEGNDYIRELVVDTTTVGQIGFTSTVYWQGRDKQIQLSQTLKSW